MIENTIKGVKASEFDQGTTTLQKALNHTKLILNWWAIDICTN